MYMYGLRETVSFVFPVKVLLSESLGTDMYRVYMYITERFDRTAGTPVNYIRAINNKHTLLLSSCFIFGLVKFIFYVCVTTVFYDHFEGNVLLS